MKTLIVYFSRTGENSVNGEIEIITKGFTEVVAERVENLSPRDGSQPQDEPSFQEEENQNNEDMGLSFSDDDLPF